MPKERSMFFKVTAVIFIFLVIAGGICLGSAYPVVNTSSSYYYSNSKEFNIALMFATWVAGMVPTILWYALYVHIDNQEMQLQTLNDIKYNQEKELYLLSKSTNISIDDEPKLPDTWECEYCSTENPILSQVCKDCNKPRV